MNKGDFLYLILLFSLCESMAQIVFAHAGTNAAVYLFDFGPAQQVAKGGEITSEKTFTVTDRGTGVAFSLAPNTRARPYASSRGKTQSLTRSNSTQSCFRSLGA